MDELISEFLVEAGENLEVVDSELVRFEANPTDQATLNTVFRLLHTIKGTCGFLGLARLEAVAHAGETLLGRFRDGVLPVSSEAVTVVLEAVDRIKSILAGMAETGTEPAGDDSALIAALVAISEGGAPSSEPEPVLQFEPEPERVLRPGEVSLEELEAAFNSVEPDVPVPSPTMTSPDVAPVPPVAEASPAKAEARPGGDEETSTSGDRQAQAIRVGVDVLEGLMTLVSELVLTRNQLMQVNRQMADGAFTAPL